MASTQKRTLSWILVLAMMLSMFPMTAFAADSARVYIESKEITAGSSVEVSLMGENLPGFWAAGIAFSFDTSVLTLSDVAKGAALTAADAGATVNKGTTEVNIEASGMENINVADGVLLTLTFAVADDAASGSYAVTPLMSSNGIIDSDGDDVVFSFEAGTLTIPGAAQPLTFVDGANTYDYDTIKADNYTLTAPGAGYYFAGWFDGLTVDGTKIVNEDGRYVLSSVDTADLDSFTATELRPKYEDAPEVGEYHALWVHENDTNPTVMVLEVYPASITYRKLSYTDADKQIITTNDVIRSAWTHVAGGDNGRVKLLKDMTTDDVTYKGSAESDYLNYGLWIDLNGCSITGTFEPSVSSWYSGGSVLYLRDDDGGAGAVDSSHGQGKLILDTSKKDGDTSRKVLELSGNSQHSVKWVRDVDLVCDCPNAYPTAVLFGGTTLELMDNVNITQNCQAGNTFYAMYSSDVSSRLTKIEKISNCTITTNGIIYRQDYPGTWTHMIENCTFTSTATTGNGFEISGDVTFGEGNIISTDAPTLFAKADRGGGNLYFKADGVYSAKEGGNAFDANVKFVETPVAGTVPHNNNGTLEFVGGFTLTYMSHDGTELLWKDSYATGETPVDNRSLTYPIDHVSQYTFDGWGTSVEGGVIDVTALTADTTLYAQRTLTTLPTAVIRTVGEFEPEYFALWEDALDIPTRMGPDNALTWGKAVTLQFQKDATIGSSLRAGYYKTTYDLNGHTVTYTGAKDFYGDGYTSAASSFTLTSTAEQKGTLIITGNAALIANSTSTNQDSPFTLNNVRVEAESFQPANANNTSYSTYSTPSGATGLITFFNSGTGSTAIYTLNMTDTELYCPSAPAIDYYVKKNSANAKMLMTLANCQIEGGSMAINIRGVNGANPVITLTADKDCTFKNAAGTNPIKTAASNLKLKTTYPSGYELKAIGEGWYGFVAQINYNDGTAKNADAKGDLEINAPASGAVTITTPAALAELDSLTVNAAAANVVFSAEALDDIADKATGDLVISITEGTAQTGEEKRIVLTATVGGTPVAFEGEVTVTVPFTGESGKLYAVYYDNSGTLELLQSTKTADSIIFTATHFSDYVIKENAGYNMTVATTKDHYNAGETFEATVTLTRGETEDIRGFQFDLDYDSNKLTLNSIELASDFSGANSSINAGTGFVAGATTGAGVTIDANGKLLATVSFTVNEDVVDLSTDTITLNANTAICSHALDGNELKSAVTNKTVTLHNIIVTLNADANSTVDSGASKTLYAKYNESGLYSDRARTAAVTSVTAAANTGYKLKDNANWTDGETEYADYAAIAALTFTEAKTFTLQTIAQYTITIVTAENATTTDSTDPITVDNGTKLSEAGLPTYTVDDNYVADGWYVSENNGSTWTKKDLNYDVHSDISVKYVAVPGTFNFTGDDTTGVTETKESGFTADDKVTYKTDAVLTYEYSGDDKVITGVSATAGGKSVTVTKENNNGVWTVTIPGSVITGNIKMNVSMSNLWTVTFANGAGVQTINAAATVIEGHEGYYSTVAAAKAGRTADFSIPTPVAETGYRLADEAKLWKDGSNAEFSSTALASKTFTANETFTAQAVKTYEITFDAGEHGTLSSTAALTVDEGTELSTLTLPTITPAEGYEKETPEWKITETTSGAEFDGATVTADLTYTAQYKAKTFKVTVPTVDNVTFTVAGATSNGDGTYTATYGTPVTVTMTAGDNVKVTEVKGTIGGAEKHTNTNESGIAADTWTIPGNEILGDIAVTVQSNKTFTVTVVAGDEHVHVTPSAKTYNEGEVPAKSDFTITFDAGYELDDDDGMDGINSVAEDTTYTITSKDATYKVTKTEGEDETATHGTDYEFTPGEDVVGDKIVTDVTVTIGGTSYPVTVDPETGKVVIPGADITGPIAITYHTIDGKWKFITYDAYKGSKTGYQIAILETSYLADSKFSLSGYGETYYSEPTAYGGYVWFVDYQETANTLTAKLTTGVAGAADKLTYVELPNGATVGDINGSGIVTAADAGIINDVLHQNASTGVIYTISDKMRFELDVMGDGSVTAQDVQWILDEVVGNTH